MIGRELNGYTLDLGLCRRLGAFSSSHVGDHTFMGSGFRGELYIPYNISSVFKS